MEEIEVSAIKNLPSAQPEITLESAIDYLHSIGWMQEHDRVLTETAQPEQTTQTNAPNTLNALDCISRQTAIDALKAIRYGLWEIDIPSPTVPEYVEHHEQIKNMMEITDGWIKKLEEQPTAHPEPKWIPVEKGLPKTNEKDEDGIQRYYLIQNEFGDMMVAGYRERLGYTWWEQMYQYRPIEDNVIAYMPLPKPYERREK